MPMSRKDPFAIVAAKYGHVDPTDGHAVQQFFESVLPTLPPHQQQQIFDAVFFQSTGLPGDLDRLITRRSTGRKTRRRGSAKG